MRNAAVLAIAALLGFLGMLAWILLDERTDAPDRMVTTPPVSQDVRRGADGATPPTGARRTGQPAPENVEESTRVAAGLCGGGSAAELLPAGGTLFGHFPFSNAPAGSLVAAPSGFGGGNCSQVHRDMAGPLRSLIAAAQAEDPAVGRDLTGISCYRSIQRQVGLFCRSDRIASRGYAGQARWVAPPGYSEHSTGLTLDFGSRSESGCNLEPCFASTRAGRWLAANARRFGFEMSFPAGNAQGVAYEPWHFRYVGGGTARAVFAQAGSNGVAIGGPAVAVSGGASSTTAASLAPPEDGPARPLDGLPRDDGMPVAIDRNAPVNLLPGDEVITPAQDARD